METMPFTDNPFFKDLDEAARFFNMPLTEQEEYEYLQRNRLIRQLNEDFKIKVKLIEIDEKTGKFRLSHKVLLPKPEGYTEPESKPRGDRGERRNDRGPRNNDRKGGDRNEHRNDRGPRNNDRRHDHRPHNHDNQPAQEKPVENQEPKTPELPDFPELD